jgi:alanine-glyoxylate transaminase/serine-glyoxylate transaminase/serine-pyruvate transaminase
VHAKRFEATLESMFVPSPLKVRQRVLMGPGPSHVPDSVLAALALPTLGHLDPAFLHVMDEVRRMLADLLGATEGRATAISATGSAGMETCLVNLLEPGERALIVRAGVFGTRMAEVATRAGAVVDAFDVPWGSAFDFADLERFAAGRRYRLIAFVHGETSTGVEQPLEGARALADRLGALLVVDAVTTLGGRPLDVNRSGIDALYSGTQKCLSCPPGLAPLYFGPRALERLKSRKVPVQSWYLDLSLIEAYWGSERAYHHTAPINMVYALHEALRLCVSEGLPTRIARHERAARALYAGLEALGLELAVRPEHRLAPLTAVRVPAGVDEATLRKRLLLEHDLEIGGGLGPMKGTTWRIGLMGAGATLERVETCLRALGAVLGRNAESAVTAAKSAADRS